MALAGGAVALLLSGCGTLAYYGQLVSGHLDLMARREPVEVALARGGPELQDQLLLAMRVRRFASTRLALPWNDSYRSYADLERGYVVWNVIAAPALSLQPLQACFPLVGCLPYRGFFDRARAEAHARALAAGGYDVYDGPVAAYSSLGWFDDPLLNTMLERGEPALVRLVFHELAHQRLFVAGDAGFSEAYAEFVARQGWLDWRQARGGPAALAAAERALAREDEVLALLAGTRERLEAVYATGAAPSAQRAAKARILAESEARYGRWREAWGGTAPYQGLMAGGLNNARLATVHTYTGLLRGFQRLFERSGRCWPLFHRRVEALAGLPAQTRTGRLEALAGAVGDAGSLRLAEDDAFRAMECGRQGRL